MGFEHSHSRVAPSTPDALRSMPVQDRSLKLQESALLEAVLSANSATVHVLLQLTQARVEEMADGGMRSLQFGARQSRRMGGEVATATYVDIDGVPVEISVNVDESGDLIELDMWKANFSPLLHFPEPGQVKVG